MTVIEILQADITKLSVDVIVNAANERMLGGGGVDGAIHRAAGPELLEACRSVAEVRPGVRCPTGECRITPGFKLPAKFVIHTVGPIWCGGESNEAHLLANCYRTALILAKECGAKSIAFPAISCGVYGYPIDAACDIAVATAYEYTRDSSSLRNVFLVAFGDEIFQALSNSLKRF